MSDMSDINETRLPTTPASCAQCGRLVGPNEAATVAGQTVCHTCVQAIRARVAAEMEVEAATTTVAAPPSLASLGDTAIPPPPVRSASASDSLMPVGAYAPAPPPLPHLGASPLGAPSAYADTAPRPLSAVLPSPIAPFSLGRAILGVFLGFILGLVSTIIWVTIVYFIHFNFSIFAIGVGFAVGFGIVKGAGRGGTGFAITSALMTLAFCAVGEFLIGGGHISPMGFLFMAIGTYYSFALPKNAK